MLSSKKEINNSNCILLRTNYNVEEIKGQTSWPNDLENIIQESEPVKALSRKKYSNVSVN